MFPQAVNIFGCFNLVLITQIKNMNNQGAGLPGGLPVGQQPGQGAPGIRPVGSAAQALPGAVQGIANPGLAGLPPLQAQQQAIFLHQMHTMQYGQLVQAGKLTQEILDAHPHFKVIHAMQQQFLSQQFAARPAAAAAMAAAAGKAPSSGKMLSGIPTLPTAPGSVNAFLQQQKMPTPAAMPAPAPAAAAPVRKRKAEHYRLPDRRWDILPDSPLFVSLQDAERRIDAAVEKKMAALTELSASAKRGKNTLFLHLYYHGTDPLQLNILNKNIFYLKK